MEEGWQSVMKEKYPTLLITSNTIPESGSLAGAGGKSTSVSLDHSPSLMIVRKMDPVEEQPVPVTLIYLTYPASAWFALPSSPATTASSLPFLPKLLSS